jgi:diguanylate cyclase (GGDEF)-like protein/PAS domain S-box-containing protein
MSLAQIAQERDRLAAILQSMGDGVLCTDATRAVTFMNAQAEALTGWAFADAEGMPVTTVFALVQEEGASAVQDPVQECTRTGMPVISERGHILRAKDGAEKYVGFSVALVRLPGGDQQGAVVILNDISEVRTAEKVLKHRATHDSLTGLPNRASFLSALTEILSDAHRRDTHVLCLLDLDHFKNVNDQGGHAAGDAVLRGVAGAIRRVCPSRHIVARLGGDEFAVLMINCDEKQAEWLGSRIIREIRNKVVQYEGQAFRVGASIGATLLDGSQSDPSSVLHQADTASYASKRRGRNCFTMHAAADAEWDVASMKSAG